MSHRRKSTDGGLGLQVICLVRDVSFVVPARLGGDARRGYLHGGWRLRLCRVPAAFKC